MTLLDPAINTTTLAQMEEIDVALIIQILQEDGQEAVSAAVGKGKQPVGSVTDAQVALDLFLEEIEKAKVFASDRRMTKSMQEAARADGHAIILSQEEERFAEHDHSMSIAINNGHTAPPTGEPPLAGHANDAEDYDLIEKLSCIYIDGIDDIEGDRDESDDNGVHESNNMAEQAESSTWAAFKRSKYTRQKHNCIACGDRKHFAQLARAPCGDEYCRECFSHLFQSAMVDETLFPPRCCKQPIPLERNRLFLSADLVQQFRKKATEFSTPNRTYCHDPTCAVFIPPKNYTALTASCEECGDQTCITCKSASHVGDCPNDAQLQQVIQLAREHGWQRCQNCWGMVELDTGCNHMT